MNKQFSARDISFIIVSSFFILLFWAPFFDIQGNSISLYKIVKFIFTAFQSKKKSDASSIDRTTFIFLILFLTSIASIVINSFTALVQSLAHQTEAARNHLVTVSLSVVFLWVFGSYDKGDGVGKVLGDAIEGFFKQGSFASYIYFVGGIAMAIFHGIIPDTTAQPAASTGVPYFPLPPGMPLVAPGTLACPQCQLVQARGSRFCKSCGTPLLHTCKKCNADLELDAKFCPNCGQTTLATCGKCQKPTDPSGKFCEHCGTPNPSAAIPVTAKRKEIFVGSMQYVLNPAETGIEFCAECGEKSDKSQMYYNDEVKKYIHRDCLIKLNDDPSDDVIV